MSIGLYCEFSYLSFLRQHRSDFAKIDSMADSAFERVDIGLFKRGMDDDVGGVCIALERNELAGFADTKTIFSHMYVFSFRPIFSLFALRAM